MAYTPFDPMNVDSEENASKNDILSLDIKSFKNINIDIEIANGLTYLP